MKIIDRKNFYKTFKEKRLWRCIDFDKMYWYQCVDLVKQYAKEIYWVRLSTFGWSAYTWFENKSLTFDSKWKKVEHFKWNIPIAWDLIFWKPIKWNPYWHVAIAWIWSTTEKLVILEQNYVSWRSSHFWKWNWPASITERVRDYKDFSWSWRFMW